MQDATLAIETPARDLSGVALPLRHDTILGVCEAIGQDFGFNANLLRVPLAAGILFSPLGAVTAYFALMLAVVASRLLFPAGSPDTLALADDVSPASRKVANDPSAGEAVPLAA